MSNYLSLARSSIVDHGKLDGLILQLFVVNLCFFFKTFKNLKYKEQLDTYDGLIRYNLESKPIFKIKRQERICVFFPLLIDTVVHRPIYSHLLFR